jgi:hypothetical protein
LLDTLPDDWEPPQEPEFPAWAGWIFECWRDLDGDRESIPVGMGGSIPGRIPWTAVDRWARRYAIGPPWFEFLVRALRVMDALLIEHQRRKLPPP